MTYYQPVQHAQFHRQPRNGFGITALVLGIVALVLGFIPFVSLFTAIPIGIVGGIFGILGVVRTAKRIATNKVASIFGLVASILAILLALASSIVTGAFFSSLSSDHNDKQSAAQPAGNTEEEEPKTDQFPGQTEDDLVGKPGEEISTRGVKVTAEELKGVNDTFGNQLCSKVTIKNDGDTQVSYNAYDWKLQYPSGDIKDTTLSGSDPLHSGDIAQGGSADGNLCFDDTGETGKYVLISEDVFSFSNERAVWITER